MSVVLNNFIITTIILFDDDVCLFLREEMKTSKCCPNGRRDMRPSVFIAPSNPEL